MMNSPSTLPMSDRLTQDAQSLAFRPETASLLTDLYELTMAACYVGEGLDQRPASFELFIRRLPANFGYLIAMGLAQALDFLEQFHFSADQLAALQKTEIFAHAPAKFWQVLADQRFTGTVWAVPEGTAIFANEPLLRVEAPLWQAQIVETYLLNALNYQTLIATRAARMRDAAGEQAHLLEFGTRRAFSPQASLYAARAALAAGLDATSNVLAALQLGQKPAGTMAHSLVMALAATEGSEAQAFAAFHRYFPGAALLIDTYDTIAAAERLAEQRQRGEMTHLAGVRIDSGDLLSLSKRVRHLLPDVPIFASGDLDEFRIAELMEAGACIDGYGLGTQLVTGVPVNGVYKLVDIDGIPVMKESTAKVTYPGRKQIFRCYDRGQVVCDRLGLLADAPETPALDNESQSESGEQSLLRLVMQNGVRLDAPEPLAAIAQRTRQSVTQLPASVRRLRDPEPLPITLSSSLVTLLDQTKHRLHSPPH